MGKAAFLQARWHLGAASLVLGLVAGCGGGGGSVGSTPAPSPTPSPSPTATPTPTPTPSSSFLTTEYNRSDGSVQHGAIAAWVNGDNGSGVTIGIVDGGIDTHSPEFTGRISPASRDVAGNRGLDNPDSDHGTNVALVAAAARDNTGVMGIAYNATLAVFRTDQPGSCATYDANVPDSGCNFFDADIAQGVNAAVAAGAKVINLSLGGSLPDQVLRDAVAAATSAGVVVVVSAGNDGESTKAGVDPTNPDPFATNLQAVGNGAVIIAGSVDASNVISTFSNKAGSEANWFLAARGERVCCVYENGVMKVVTNADGSRSVYVFSGTSFSAPQIAGAAALLRQAFPNLTGAQVVDLLLRTARDAGAVGIDAIYGRGILDIAAAFSPQGATSLAGGVTAMPLGDTTFTTSSAMGDAGRRTTGLGAIVLDGYGRAYKVDLAANLRSAPIMPRLGPALLGETRQLGLGGDGLNMAFAVDARGRAARLAWQGPLALSRSDAEQARVLAGSAIARLSPRTMAAFGVAQGPDGLIAQLRDPQRQPFLIARSPRDDLGFSRSGETAVALRQELGAWGLSASASRARAISVMPFDPALSITPYRFDPVTRFGLGLDRTFGPVAAALGLSLLDERHTVLGARLHEALGGAGAISMLIDAEARWSLAPGWQIGAAGRIGLVRPRAGGSVSDQSRLTASAWSLDLARGGLFGRDDVLAFRLSQPLRVESGALALNLPVSYDYATLSPGYAIRPLSLTPTGREIDGEIAWRGALWDGSAFASLFYRHQPGHIAELPADTGFALGWNRQF